jgi:Flp pilus assembly pilin Flp
MKLKGSMNLGCIIIKTGSASGGKMIRNHKQQGQGMTEYMLLLVLLAVVVILVLRIGGVTLKQVFCKTITSLGGKPALCSNALFQDDFNNLKNWQIVNGNWQSINGQLCGGGGEGRIFSPISGATDYVVNLNGATMTKGNGYGLYFRSSNVSKVNGYSFQFDPGYGEYILREWYQGNEFSNPIARYKPTSPSWNSTHNVQIIVRGSTYTASVDGKQVFQISDPSYTMGGIGLRTWDSTQVCFDSISVNPIP